MCHKGAERPHLLPNLECIWEHWQCFRVQCATTCAHRHRLYACAAWERTVGATVRQNAIGVSQNGSKGLKWRQNGSKWIKIGQNWPTVGARGSALDPKTLPILPNAFQIWQQMGPLGPFVAKFGTRRPKGRKSMASAAPLQGIWLQFPLRCVLAVLILPT